MRCVAATCLNKPPQILPENVAEIIVAPDVIATPEVVVALLKLVANA